MISNLVSMFTNVFTQNTQVAAPVTQKSSQNPFANPFVSYSSSNSFYGKNKPVKGGYFAGYYNGAPNIVGKRLFIEV